MRERPILCPDALVFASYMTGMLIGEERKRLDQHIALCQACREHLAAVVRLGSRPVPMPSDTSFPRAWARMEAKFAQWSQPKSRPAVWAQGSADVIELVPRPRYDSLPTMDRLAATSPSTEPSEPATYASRDKTVVAKLVQTNAGAFEIYLVSDDPVLVRGVLTRLVDTSGKLIAEGISDEFGVLAFPELVCRDAMSIRMVLTYPHLTVSLEPALWRDRLIATGSTDLPTVEGHSLRLDMVERHSRREYRIDFSGLRTDRPACCLRVYSTREGRSTEIPVGPEGAVIFREPYADQFTLRAYVVPP